MTLETFLAWKKRKREEKIEKLEQDMERRKADFKAGKALMICGREVFEFHPEMINDDDKETYNTLYFQGMGGDKVDYAMCVNDKDTSLYIPRDVEDICITVDSLESFTTYVSDKDDKLSEASGGLAVNVETDLEEESGWVGQENSSIEDVILDENLFTGKHLDELEKKLNTLDVEEV